MTIHTRQIQLTKMHINHNWRNISTIYIYKSDIRGVSYIYIVIQVLRGVRIIYVDVCNVAFTCISIYDYCNSKGPEQVGA
jgi:hypothetical protein